MRTASALLLLALAAPVASAQTPVRYRMVKTGDVTLPRITSGATSTVRARVNQSIQGIHADYEDCTPYGDSEVTRADRRYFSFIHTSSTDCGGAHPINEMRGYTYDMRTGRALEDFGLDSLKQDALWDEAYRTILPGLRQDSARAVLLPEDERSCMEAAPMLHGPQSEYRSYLLFALSAQGLLVWPELPHVVYGCTVQGMIPYSRIRPFLAPSSPLR